MERGGSGHKRNARERTRVHTVNKAFHILKHHLPALRIHSKRVSKLRILKAAIVYINTLMDSVGNHSNQCLSARETVRRPSHRSIRGSLPALAASTAPITPPMSSKNLQTSTDMPCLRSLIDSAPYVPQFSAFTATNSNSIGATTSAPSNEFASILSTATASLGYSYPWNSYNS